MTTAVPEADIRLDRVSKHFHEVVAVDDLSLDILRGEFFSMLGPSGCGKTTTLRMIAGFEDATAGAIYLGGADVTNLPPFRRDVNTVFQNYALFPHLTVYDNVAFGPRRKHLPESEVRASVGRMLDLVQLRGYDRRKPSQMSGGQQQRVALARALINHPKVLLLDEPLGALDLKLRKQMQIELKRIQTEVGITFVYVTHDQEEAMTMSDRIAVMRAGKIEQLGTPEELYERPTTEFVAGFLGVSNLLDGRVDTVSDGRAVVVLSGGTRVRVPANNGDLRSRQGRDHRCPARKAAHQPCQRRRLGWRRRLSRPSDRCQRAGRQRGRRELCWSQYAVRRPCRRLARDDRLRSER